ncbi:MAG: hypothetical protein ABI634_02870 [Acidobacteriota bacterium]
MLLLTQLALVAAAQRDPDPACSASIWWAVAPQIQSLSHSVQPRALTAFGTPSRNCWAVVLAKSSSLRRFLMQTTTSSARERPRLPRRKR